MEEDKRIRTTNRHIAKILSRISPLKIPQIAIDEIKREMWFLSDDLKQISDMGKTGEGDEDNKTEHI